MLSNKKISQIFLLLILNSIALFKIKPMAKPVSQKFDIGVSSERHLRRNMEDKYTVIENWGNTGTTFAGVYDGHGGKRVAEYLEENLHARILQIFQLQEIKDLKEAIRQGCAQINQEILANDEIKEQGSCAIMAFIFENEKDKNKYKIIIANVGDSRAVISKNGKAIQLSTDHKPCNPAEQERIETSRGFITYSFSCGSFCNAGSEEKCLEKHRIGRINGGLAVARAFGDFQYSIFLSTEPEITKCGFCKDDVLILASDGLWDGIENEEAILLANASSDMKKASEILLEKGKYSSPDNITVITIRLKP